MILFAADNHYGMHPGRVLHEQIADRYQIEFHEDDWSCLEQPDLAERYELLMLNMIADTCGVAPPPRSASGPVRAYLESGKPVLLLHGASAAFWQWDWWRPLVGFRWVRGEDPDGVATSTHPTREYALQRAKVRHPLAAALREIELPADEIYIDLEQTCPTLTLLETQTDEGTFPQCYETRTPWGGRLMGYLPGHAPEVVRHPDMVANCCTLIDNLLPGERG